MPDCARAPLQPFDCNVLLAAPGVHLCDLIGRAGASGHQCRSGLFAAGPRALVGRGDEGFVLVAKMLLQEAPQAKAVAARERLEDLAVLAHCLVPSLTREVGHESRRSNPPA